MSGPFREKVEVIDQTARNVAAQIRREVEVLRAWGLASYAVTGGVIIIMSIFVLNSYAPAAPSPPPTPVSQAETQARRSLTIEQDRALCARACGHNLYVASECEWDHGGVRECECSCHGRLLYQEDVREQR